MLSALILLAVTLFLIKLSIKQNNGNFVYALDDPYIHMAIAKNFSQFGVWGVDKYSFGPASSSVLWTLILSVVFYFFGLNEWALLIINLVVCFALLFAINNILGRKIQSTMLLTCLVLYIAFSAPFPLLIFTGQEHLFHSLITLVFAYKSAKILSLKRNEEEATKISPKDYAVMSILAILLVGARFEGLFLLFIVFLYSLIRRKIAFGFFLLLSGMAVVIIFGIISVFNNGYFLPNSVLLKGNMPNLSNLRGILKFFGGFAIYQMVKNPVVLVLFTIAIFLLWEEVRSKRFFFSFGISYLLLFVGALLLHLQFARVGGFFRYESYLVVFGIVGIVLYLSSQDYLFGNWQKRKTIFIGILIVLSMPFIERALSTIRLILPATKNIYEQQYQMGQFIRKYYNGSTIALNDIGAVNFFADVCCIDLFGLANTEVASLILSRKYNTKHIQEIARKNKVKIAILYEIWFERFGGLPLQWQLVEKWKISNNVVCGDAVVSFFAVSPNAKDSLEKFLQEFQAQLPKDVKIIKFY